LDEITDELMGKVGSPERDSFDAKVDATLYRCKGNEF